MGNKINLVVSDGDAFFTHQASINFNPTMLFFDFNSITQIIDERGTLDVTIMEFGDNVFEVKSTSGNTQLDGTDMIHPL